MVVEIKPYTHWQQLLLAITPAITGSLSIIGSSAILWLICSDWKNKIGRVKYRILFGLSCSDVINSIVYIFWVLPIPKGTENVMGAKGNATTCNVQGVFQQMGAAGALYNGALSHYFYCSICIGMKGEDFAVSFERWWHAVAILYPLITGMAGILLDSYAYTSLGCWFGPEPFGCKQDDNIDCTRGELGYVYGWLFMGIPLILMLTAIGYFMFQIYLTVKEVLGKIETYNFRSRGSFIAVTPQASSTLRRGSSSSFFRRPSFLGGGGTGSSNRNGNAAAVSELFPPEALGGSRKSINSFDTPVSTRRSRWRSRQRETAVQAFLYISAYLITHICAFLVYILDQTGTPQPFWTVWLVLLSWPLQGFFNVLIFLRPRIKSIREQYSNRNSNNDSSRNGRNKNSSSSSSNNDGPIGYWRAVHLSIFRYEQTIEGLHAFRTSRTSRNAPKVPRSNLDTAAAAVAAAAVAAAVSDAKSDDGGRELVIPVTTSEGKEEEVFIMEEESEEIEEANG